MQWLFEPISATPIAHLDIRLAWHGRSMVIAWGMLIPIGVLVARYWKLWPRQTWPQELDNPSWWHLHRVVQSLALLIMSLGTYLAYQATKLSSINGVSAQLHAALGWVVLVAAWLQVIGGMLRGSKGGPTDLQMRGDHYDMSPRRRVFEWTHKALGWGSLLLACCVMALGLYVAQAPRWMPLILLLWWCLLLGLAWRWQRQGRCIDTYQAIWGDDPSLPGLGVLPIGWGIRRVTPSQLIAHPLKQRKSMRVNKIR